jgi:hypothetical protein
MTKKTIIDDFLFATPTRISGVARFFDLAGAFDAYNISETGEEADAKAMYADWAMVGEDLRCSIIAEVDEDDIGKAA